MGLLAGKTVIITGASSALREAAALLFATESAEVVLWARATKCLVASVARIGALSGAASCLAGDVRDEEFAARLVAVALERFGRL